MSRLLYFSAIAIVSFIVIMTTFIVQSKVALSSLSKDDIATPTIYVHVQYATATTTCTPSSTSTDTPTFTPTSTPTPTNTPTNTLTPTPTDTPTITPTPTSTPNEQVPESGRFIFVDQQLQIMFIYENEKIVREIPVSTGKPDTNSMTPAWKGRIGDYWGRQPFSNTQLWADDIWYLFKGPKGSILIHSVPYILENGTKKYDNLEALGISPASRGCVRVSPKDAKWLHRWNPIMVPIEITPWTGEVN